MATTYKIHPAIGIARVGNSSKWFIGPEDLKTPEQTAYKSETGRIKRQAVRFRIWEYSSDQPVRERIPGREFEAVWQVQLTNRKAALVHRNRDIKDRKRLVIDAGQETVSTPRQGPFELTGKFQGQGNHPQDVVLGEIRTDKFGRLIVLGGRGRSFSPTGADIVDCCDNDDWCDDISDGPVRAFLRFNDSDDWIEAESSWVFVAPPKFAPLIHDPCTLFDRIYQTTKDKFGIDFDPLLSSRNVSFRWHIYPFLERAVYHFWILDLKKFRNYLEPDVFRFLKDNSQTGEPQRKREEAHGDLLNFFGELDITMPPWRMEVLDHWKRGNFQSDWERPLSIEDSFAIDRAALDQSLGSIPERALEVPRMLFEKSTYHAPFRIRVGGPIQPGSLTASLPVPWQADFRECEWSWAPISPRWVLVHPDPEPKRRKWSRGVSSDREMVDDWSLLGYVRSAGGAGLPGKHPFEEKERNLQHDQHEHE